MEEEEEPIELEPKPHTEQQLRTRLARLLRVKEVLLEDGQTIPPELVAR